MTVTALHVFASFDELYRALPLIRCGYTQAELPAASPDDMLAYYSKEQQQRYGVVGIAVAVLHQDDSAQETTLSSAFG